MFQIRLKELREREKISQKALAQILGVSQSTVGMWENGKNKPEHDTLLKLANHFNVSIDYLVGSSPDYSADADPNILQLAEVPMVNVYGEIAAGNPILAQENIIGVMPFPGLKNPSEYFCLRIKGDSMINAGIQNGSTVLIHKQNYAENGQIVACLVNGESATLKRFLCKKETVVLMPENSHFEPIILNKSEFENGTARIMGVAVQCVSIHQL